MRQGLEVRKQGQIPCGIVALCSFSTSAASSFTAVSFISQKECNIQTKNAIGCVFPPLLKDLSDVFIHIVYTHWAWLQ